MKVWGVLCQYFGGILVPEWCAGAAAAIIPGIPPLLQAAGQPRRQGCPHREVETLAGPAFSAHAGQCCFFFRRRLKHLWQHFGEGIALLLFIPLIAWT